MTTDEFLKKARDLACEYLNNESKGIYRPQDIQVVWMTHLMGDKKAILFMPGTYSLFEVTYDMKSDALYFDAYAKKAHKVVEMCSQPRKEDKFKKNVVEEALMDDVFRKLFGIMKNNGSTKDIWGKLDTTL